LVIDGLMMTNQWREKMVAAVESMAWASDGGVPWHGLGERVSNNMTPVEMMKAAKCDWTVSKRPMAFKDKNGKWVEYPNRFALTRDKDDRTFDIVSHTWKPMQNAEGFEFFKKYCEAGKMAMETAGSLWDGKYIWVLARVKKDFALGAKGNDKMRSYLLMCIPHEHGKAIIIQFTAIRVVCWNTLSFALGSGLKGQAGAFRVPHSIKFDDTIKANAEAALGLATKQMDEFEAVSKLLVKARATEEKVEDYFCEVLQYDRKKKGSREPLILPKFRQALEFAPGQQIDTAKGTMWGALNAVSFVIDHDGDDRQTALKNAWFGHKATIKQRAVEVAVAYAKSK
jgi:phage/plasmid-like protein (TIGR03299 family)